jgi:hypothetical protein
MPPDNKKDNEKNDNNESSCNKWMEEYVAQRTRGI